MEGSERVLHAACLQERKTYDALAAFPPRQSMRLNQAS